MDRTSSFYFFTSSNCSLKTKQVTNILSAVSRVNIKLKVRKPRIYLTIFMPSGKQNSGSCDRFILSARADKYFSAKIALKDCSILLLTIIYSIFTFSIYQISEWQLMADKFIRMRDIKNFFTFSISAFFLYI